MKSGKISLSYGLRWKRILAIFMLIIYQLVGQVVLSSQVIKHAETMCIERLGEAARDFSINFYEHAMADREQLRVVADMMNVLMEEDTHDLSTHLAAFEQRGMLDWLQILLPDGTLITGSGQYDLSHQLSFEDEVARLPFISTISSGYVDTTKRVIRSAVPIINDGKTIAVLYGVYDLTAGHTLDGTTVFGGQSYTFILEADSGEYLLDGLRDHTSLATTGSTYTFKRGYDMNVMQNDLNTGTEGFAAFRSLTIDDYMYIYYTPIGINSWFTMISVPESVALRYAYESRDLMLGSMAYICLGVVVYFIALYAADHKLQDKNRFVSSIQAKLMEVYHKPEYYNSALTEVATRARCEALFLVDALHPQDDVIVGKNQTVINAYTQQQDVLVQDMLSLARQQRKGMVLRRSSRLLHRHPHISRFLAEYDLKSIAIVPLPSADGTIHQIFGAFAPSNPDVLALLNTVSVSFLMAANNMDYLDQLEIASTVDGLTGVMNRASYHLRLDQLTARKATGFGCVYIDVNDLHAINNRFGHEKGDAMLRCIADALNTAFGQRNVYRFGGDEFVILIENITGEWLNEKTREADAAIQREGYTVSIGTDWAAETAEVTNMIRNAEASMYKAKYLFYQQKQKQAAAPSLEHKAVRRLLTENTDVNDFLEVAEHHYRGVYFVNLQTDEVREIFAHHYFYNALQVAEKKFSVAFRQYMAEVVDKQSRRSVQNFFDYTQINEQISQNNAPTIEYTKADGERLRLTVHRSPRYTADKPESLWVFEAVHTQQ